VCLDKQAESIGNGRGLGTDILGLGAGGHGADIESGRSDDVTETEDDFLCFVFVLAVTKYLWYNVRTTNRP
jgi:hypothetical protein